MAAHYTEFRILNTPFTPLKALLKDPVFCQILKLEFQSEISNESGIWYCFNHGVTFSSWGEKITLVLSPISQGQTRVDISSECSLPTQVIDWGKNKQNTTAIFNYIISYLPHYQATTVAIPNATAYPANQKYCTCCGTALASNAKFCVKCGANQLCCDSNPQDG